jgi:hypothetical protein
MGGKKKSILLYNPKAAFDTEEKQESIKNENRGFARSIILN